MKYVVQEEIVSKTTPHHSGNFLIVDEINFQIVALVYKSKNTAIMLAEALNKNETS